jgi:RNA recognition motif-containing protein
MNTESILWMGDIEPWMSEEIIMKSFLDNNIKPKSIKMIKDKRLNLLRNYCFINFDNMIEANQAIIQLNDKKIPNTNINFKLNWANQNSEGCRNLYVGNLPPEVDYIELYSLFKSKYPSVHHASIITERGVSKGFGFVYFIDKDDYDKCLKEMDGFIFHNNALRVKERKKKNEEKNEDKNVIKNNYKHNKLFNINNDSKINQYKKMNKNQINIKETNKNYFYKINNNYSFYNQNNFNTNQLNLNAITSFYPKRKAEEDFSQESTYSSLGGEQDLSSSNSSSSKKRKFSDNIELLESDDQKTLNKKIQESVDKMFEHYKYYNKTSESKSIYIFNIFIPIFIAIVSKMIVYYCSNTFPFSDSFVF